MLQEAENLSKKHANILSVKRIDRCSVLDMHCIISLHGLDKRVVAGKDDHSVAPVVQRSLGLYHLRSRETCRFESVKRSAISAYSLPFYICVDPPFLKSIGLMFAFPPRRLCCPKGWLGLGLSQREPYRGEELTCHGLAHTAYCR